MKPVLDNSNVLSIESAVAGGSIALISRERGAFLRQEGNDCSRAEKIISVIADVLDEAGLTLPDLSMIAVSTGPGSYSGIRIGLSTALGLANALDITCTGVSVLDAMACAAGSKPGSLITAIPVGKKDVAWQAFQTGKEGNHQAAMQPELMSYSRFVDKLEYLPDLTLFAHTAVVEIISDRIPKTTSLIDSGTGLAEFVGSFASLQDGPAHFPRPIYLRNSDGAVRENAF